MQQVFFRHADDNTCRMINTKELALLSFGAAVSPRNNWSHRACGSMSTSRPLTSRLAGMARIAPSGPRMNVQMIRDRKLIVVVNPTASPTNLGCSTDWMTKLSAQ